MLCECVGKCMRVYVYFVLLLFLFVSRFTFVFFAAADRVLALRVY